MFGGPLTEPRSPLSEALLSTTAARLFEPLPSGFRLGSIVLDDARFIRAVLSAQINLPLVPGQCPARHNQDAATVFWQSATAATKRNSQKFQLSQCFPVRKGRTGANSNVQTPGRTFRSAQSFIRLSNGRPKPHNSSRAENPRQKIDQSSSPAITQFIFKRAPSE